VPVPNELIAPADDAAREGKVERYETPPDTLLCPPNRLWFFVFYPDHPGNWMAATIKAGDGVPEDDVGTWWLPVLQQEPVRPGLNGNKTIKTKTQNPKDAYEFAHLNINRNGGIVLPQELGYRYERDCIHPTTRQSGTRHIDAWSKPKKVQRGKRLKFTFDAQRYYRWLLALMRDGALPLPSEDLLDDNIGRLAERVIRRENEARKAGGGNEEHVKAAKDHAKAARAAKVPTSEAPIRRAPPRPRKAAT
jgi:hypothetical protein